MQYTALKLMMYLEPLPEPMPQRREQRGEQQLQLGHKVITVLATATVTTSPMQTSCPSLKDLLVTNAAEQLVPVPLLALLS